MNKTTEALKLVAVVLEDIIRVYKFETGTPVTTLAAIREVLAKPEITTPDVCGEVCARAKLCYGCGKALDEANAKLADHSGDSNEMIMDWSKVKPEAIKSAPMYQMGYAAALAEPVKQEPVAWMCWIDSDEEMNPANAQLTSYEPKAYAKRKPLCAAPQPVKQEPVAEIIGFERTNDIRGVKRIPRIKWNVPLWEDESPLQLGNLYAAPVRTKELTPHDITALIREGAADGGWQGFAQRVIAADRETNR